MPPLPKCVSSWLSLSSSGEFREGSRDAAVRETGELDFNKKAKVSIAAKQRLALSFDLNHFVLAIAKSHIHHR